MIKTVASLELPVNEKLLIRKNVITPEQVTGSEKRFCVVTGTHGDELEGQYVCYELNRRIREQIHYLKGTVEIYPALNPLGLDTITRAFPVFDVDMNRIFPGTDDGSVAELVAGMIVKDLAGADMCIDVHASNIYIREIPQVRLNESTSGSLLKYAGRLNTEFVWVHHASTVLESTLAHTLNMIGVPTLVVEMGVGMRSTEKFCFQLVDGIFCLMKDLGIWAGPVITPKEPVVSLGGEVGFVNAEKSGLFVPKVKHRNDIKKGEIIGEIVNPLEGTVEERLYAPCDGLIFTLRAYPMVERGSLIARILGGGGR